MKEIMAGRIATLYNPGDHREPHSHEEWGPLVLSGAQSAQQVVLVRPDAGWIRVFYTCSEVRRERLLSKSQENNTNNHNQLPLNAFKFKINLFARLY